MTQKQSSINWENRALLGRICMQFCDCDGRLESYDHKCVGYHTSSSTVDCSNETIITNTCANCAECAHVHQLQQRRVFSLLNNVFWSKQYSLLCRRDNYVMHVKNLIFYGINWGKVGII